MMGRSLRFALMGMIALLSVGLLWQELSGPEPLPPAPERADDWALPQLQPLSVPPLSAYEPVLQRPLFNPDRKPVEVAGADASADGKPEEQVEEAPPQPLEVVLRGVILLPEHRIALLEDAKGKQKLRVREGEPLKGELSQWKLLKLTARSAQFRQEGTGREEEVRLQVYGKPLPAGSTTARAAGNKGGKQQNAAGKKGKGRSEKNATGLDPDEIRRKVAERRARMRAEAARKRAQQKSKQEQ